MLQPLTINKINKSFHGRRILNDISLNVQPNEIFGLIGLNGAGKTTIIKSMLDLINQDSGEITFFDQNKKYDLSRKNICYLPEKFQPSPFLKGFEFLELSLNYHQKEFSKNKAIEMAERMSLDVDYLSKKISKYSKGMGQKLGLISMFMSEASLLILDEPMSGLDPVARINLKTLIKDYKQKGKSVFFSSHILSDIEEICDMVSIINDGKIVLQSSPKEIIKKYGKSNLEDSFLKIINNEI